MKHPLRTTSAGGEAVSGLTVVNQHALSAGAYRGYRFFAARREIFGPGNRQGRRAAGGGDRGEIRRGGKGGGWNGFRAGRVAVRGRSALVPPATAPPPAVISGPRRGQEASLPPQYGGRPQGWRTGTTVADGGNNQLFPARKLQPQRDGQGFAQSRRPALPGNSSRHGSVRQTAAAWSVQKRSGRGVD